MSLLQQIKTDSIQARRDRDTVRASLLTSLYSEAAMAGKNDGNRESTDDEVIKVIQKFSKSAEEMHDAYESAGRSDDLAKAKLELAVLESYLPQMMTEEELVLSVDDIVAKLDEKSMKAMGQVMSELKARHGATFDGKQASQIVKSRLAS